MGGSFNSNLTSFMSVTITLPDGATKQYEKPITAFQVAHDISPRLADAAFAAIVNGKLADTSALIDHDATVAIVTEKSPEALDVVRHSTAHLLAQAVKELFPSAQVTIGPVIEDGFYYDFSFERPFTPEDLEKIEAKMAELAKQNFAVTRQVMPRNEAIQFFKKLGENYKAEIIASIPENEILSLYTQGNFTDLCRGPHVPNTGKLKAFKLMKLAGAYWRGDSNNEMLQRIYGTAWLNKKDLDAYLYRLEEAEKRDHRKIAKAMDLFHLQEEAPGMIFWHPKGWAIYQTVEQYMRKMMRKHGYQEVRTPQIVDRVLWEKSGHWDKFREDMFSLKADDHDFAIKPMNCPCHVQIYNHGLRSYRDLPLRLAEFGSCHRNEASGALHGLMRTRGFTQDDAHIFCTEEQIGSEASRFIDMVFEVYRDFGFTNNISVKLSTRPAKRVGADEIWDKAEKALEQVLNDKKLNWQLMPGEGAFYGPKIEFVLTDCMGRQWTTGSIQLDFSMPARLGAEYIAESNERKTPVMLHRAIFGSLERFIGILLEHYAGHLPVWLAPVQAVVMNISEKQAEYTLEVALELQKMGFRVTEDLRNEKIGFKIRSHTLEKVPFMLVIGDREMNEKKIAVRSWQGEDLGSMSVDEFAEKYLK
ncbi:MAG: threonyl-tRNA synthetase [Gammaproteobacteria bacterium]|jgi:threonyl-tRNA synthetase|nr:threonyl-tRNA synthetase [Gammaproteobacteria bacterium]